MFGSCARSWQPGNVRDLGLGGAAGRARRAPVQGAGLPAGHPATAATVHGHACGALRHSRVRRAGADRDPGCQRVGSQGRGRGEVSPDRTSDNDPQADAVTTRLDRELLRREAAGQLVVAIDELDLPRAMSAVDEATGSVRALSLLHAHLMHTPDALTSGDSDAPLAHQRLTGLLIKAGFAQVVAPKCARCHEPKVLRNRVEGGRSCGPCYRWLNPRQCSRCGVTTRLGSKTAEGSICDNCYFLAHREACAACNPPSPGQYPPSRWGSAVFALRQDTPTVWRL